MFRGVQVLVDGAHCVGSHPISMRYEEGGLGTLFLTLPGNVFKHSSHA